MEHVFFSGGMWIMTGSAAIAVDNTMNIGHRIVFIKQL